MKGRQNYICKRRLNDAQAVLDLFEDEQSEIAKIKGTTEKEVEKVTWDNAEKLFLR